jgi:hypothetical protein
MNERPLPKADWLRLRAEEYRTIAEAFDDRETRERMLNVARDYERLALKSEELERSATIPQSTT